MGWAGSWKSDGFFNMWKEKSVTRKMHSTPCPCHDVSTLVPTQKGGHFTEVIFKFFFLYGNRCILIPILPKMFQSIPIKPAFSPVRHQHIMWGNKGPVMPSLMGWGLARVIWHHVCGIINRPRFICSIHRFVETGLNQWKLMLHAWHLWDDTRSVYLSKVTIQITILAVRKRHIKIKYVTKRLQLSKVPL